MSDVAVNDVNPLATLAGKKHVGLLRKHLRRLRKAYGHGNRKLFFDELVSAYLLAFFLQPHAPQPPDHRGLQQRRGTPPAAAVPAARSAMPTR